MARVADELVDALGIALDEVATGLAGAVESLNVSVASAVCLYEALRQRLKAGTATLPAAADTPAAADIPTEAPTEAPKAD